MRKLIALFLALASMPALVLADEGMWTFDNPPVKQLKEKYNFTPTQEWLDHVRLSSVRFNDGGSGSFISPQGLTMTNHHVALGQLQKMSTAEKNYVATGFYAATLDEEVKCPDLELYVLQDLENVRSCARRATTGLKPEQALKRVKRDRGHRAGIQDKTGLKCEVVSLYHGGEYWAYQYQRYTDVRLVMAPEQKIAFWGGDADNFTFPRYDLDMAFFRVYENGQPLRTTHYLKWNAKGAEEDELVFVSGHPGSTNRLNTYSQLEYQRDFSYPQRLAMIDKQLEILRAYSSRGAEQARRAARSIFGLENSRKALGGEYQGLLDEKLMAKAKAQEDAFRKKVNENPLWKKEYGDGWDIIAKVIKKQSKNAEQNSYRGMAQRSHFVSIANQIVFYAAEVKKPDSERLSGYHDSQLEQLKFRLFSPAPIYKDLDEATFSGMLQLAVEKLGAEDPYLQKVLKGRSAAQAAKEMIEATTLDQADVRKALIEGGSEAVARSTDPFIVLARQLEPEQRKRIEEDKKNTQSLLVPATEKIARARFTVYGKESYPDATFTLRLSYGTAKGYAMNGTKAPYKTSLYGLYDRSLSFNQQGDFALPPRFWERKDQLDLATPVNFVSSNDIIGGNSGSPVINRDAELVGLIFDGNIESLVGRFVYDETSNRAVAVHSAFMIEALRKLYDAGKLAAEILGE